MTSLEEGWDSQASPAELVPASFILAGYACPWTLRMSWRVLGVLKIEDHFDQLGHVISKLACSFRKEMPVRRQISHEMRARA